MYKHAFLRGRRTRKETVELVTRETIRMRLILENQPKPNPFSQSFETEALDLEEFGPGYWSRRVRGA